MPETVPANAGYMIAAYIVTAVILLSYTVAMLRRGSASKH